MVMIPGADLRFRNNHGKEIEAQQVGVGHGGVKDKVQRTECKNTCNWNSIFGMLEGSESKSRFLCPLKSAGSRFWHRGLESASTMRASEPRTKYVGFEDEFRQPIFCAQCQTLIAQLCLLCVLQMHDVEIE